MLVKEIGRRNRFLWNLLLPKKETKAKGSKRKFQYLEVHRNVRIALFVDSDDSSLPNKLWAFLENDTISECEKGTTELTLCQQGSRSLFGMTGTSCRMYSSWTWTNYRRIVFRNTNAWIAPTNIRNSQIQSDSEFWTNGIGETSSKWIVRLVHLWLHQHKFRNCLPLNPMTISQWEMWKRSSYLVQHSMPNVTASRRMLMNKLDSAM